MIVREFQEQDAEAVSTIMFESFRTFLGSRMDGDKPTPPEDYVKNASFRSQWLHGQSFCALIDDVVVGYISVSANLQTKLGILEVIGVSPKCMAHGVGTALFQAAWKFWTERDMNKIYTCTSSINTNAQRYYARMGFIEEGRRRGHFFGDVDEISLVIFPNRKKTADVNVSLRPMNVNDASAVTSILSQNNEITGWSEERLASFMQSGDAIFTPKGIVAINNDTGNIVGALVSNYIEKYRLAMIQFLFVAPAMRNMGIGTILLETASSDWHTNEPTPQPVRKADCAIPLNSCAGLPFMMHKGFVVEETLCDQAGPGTAEIHLGKFFE